MGQALGQPTLHATRRNDHDLALERVLQRMRQQLAETLGEESGVGCAMEVECHSRTLEWPADP